MLLPFQGDINTLSHPQGDCPGLTAFGPSGRSPYLQSVSLVFTLFHFDTPLGFSPHNMPLFSRKNARKAPMLMAALG